MKIRKQASTEVIQISDRLTSQSDENINSDSNNLGENSHLKRFNELRLLQC